jgi:hypothetical protein
MQDWKGIWEKAHEVDSTKAYTTNDKTSHWILNVSYISMHMYIPHLRLWSGSFLHRLSDIHQNAIFVTCIQLNFTSISKV